MKLLVIGHTYIAPINRIKWTTLAQAYPQSQVCVVIPTHWKDVFFTLNADDPCQYSADNCQFAAMETQSSGNEVLYRYSWLEMLRLMRSFKPDVIYVEQGVSALSYFQIILLSFIAAPRAKRFFFTWVNWEHLWPITQRLFWSMIERFNLFFSSGAIVGNSDARALLLKKGFSRPIQVLPQLGVELGMPHSACPECFFARKNVSKGERPQQKSITFIGRFVPEKGIFVLLKSFEKLAEEYPDWTLRFVGQGPERENLERAVAASLRSHQIKIEPAVSHQEVFKLLKSVDILVLPSYDVPHWREQFGHILIEAMAESVPVIGTDAGEIPCVIGDAGLVAYQNNEEALAQCLRTFMSDDSLRNSYAQKGYERVKKNYTHEAIARGTFQFFNH